MIYRHKPIEVEAFQITKNNVLKIIEWMNASTAGWQTDPPAIWIDTIEGRASAYENDWIIKDINGNISSCKNSVFIKSYDEAQ